MKNLTQAKRIVDLQSAIEQNFSKESISYCFLSLE